MGADPLDWRLVYSVTVSLVLHAVIAMTGGGGSGHSAHSIAPALSVTFAKGATAAYSGSQHEVAVARPVDSVAQLLPGRIPALPVDDHYYAADEVDVRAEFVHTPEVEYPDRALFAEVSGIVRVRVLINESGVVDAVEVLAATPPEVFDKAVMEALTQSRFSPARKFGLNVKSEKIYEFNLVAEDVWPLPR